MSKQRPKAFSYTRFSTPEQAQGDSARRQLAAAEVYAAQHELDLDQNLTFRDLGVSAYRGRNAGEGQLGDFLRAVEAGAVPKGSYLLVENLDRISRQKPRKALRTLEDIVEAGITVVTMTDRKAYTVDSLDGDPFALMMAILTFIRAHEESELKGRRVRAAWENKRRRAADEGVPLTKRTPGWLVLGANGKYRLDQRRAEIVRRIFRMALSGVGQHAIAERLNRDSVKPFNADLWHRSYVKKILENPAVVGRLIAHRVEYSNGRRVRKPVVEVERFFPSVIPLADWTRVQEMRDTGKSGSRSRSAPKSGACLQNILAGIARCPKCEGTMTRVSKGPTGGYPYLICAKAKAGAGCHYKSIRMETVEQALYQNFDYLLGTIPTGDQTVDDRLDQIDSALSDLSDQAGNVTAAIAERGITGALGDRLALLEHAIAELEKEQKGILAKLEDSPLLNMKVEELSRELSSPKPDRRRVNALLRQMARAVVVDYPCGNLVFQWKHGGESRVVYAWPTEPDDFGEASRT